MTAPQPSRHDHIEAQTAPLEIFLSVVLVERNRFDELQSILREVSAAIAPSVSDYELVIVDNASEDESVATLRTLTGEDGIPNLQVYALTKEVDLDTAAWVGLENALGDFVAVIDPWADDILFLPSMLARAVSGADVVTASNEQGSGQGLAYRICFSVFNGLYKIFNGISLAGEAPPFRVLSRRVVNFILQHPAPALTYRHLPATGGFPRANLSYRAKPRAVQRKRLGESIDRGMRLLISTTRGPMRLVTSLSLFGAFSNLVYSIYVIAVWFFKSDIAPGWVTLSLQQSGMFLLISLVLLVLGEYILNMVSLTSEGPRFSVAQEFSSAVITRRGKLNIEEPRPAGPPLHPAQPPRHVG